jgi:hypothetical protein
MVNQVRTLDFLPEIFKTETNDQFLSSTLDVLTKQPNMTRVQGYIGNKYGYAINAGDNYITEPTATRSNYQLDPAVVFLKEDTQSATDFIDYPSIIAALSNAGAVTDNHNKLFSNKFYSWDSFADIDKLVNYAQYYWLPLGPDAIQISQEITIDDILDKTSYTAPNGLEFVNGLKVNFGGIVHPENYKGVDYYVEGVGTSITLVPANELLCTEVTGGGIYTPWDNDPFDTVDWSISLYVPIQPDYIVMSRSSRERNAWSRGNRWFHQGVLDAHIKYNGVVTNNQYNTQTRAQRPIVEFQGNMSLYNSGTSFAAIVDFIDTRTKDALSLVAGQEHFIVSTDVNRTSNRVSTDGIVVNDTTNLVEGMKVTFSAITGTLPSPLSSATTYEIRSIDNVLSAITISSPSTTVNGSVITPNVIVVTPGAYDMKVSGISEIGLLNDTTVVFANDDDVNVRKTVYKVTSVEAGAGQKKIIALTPLPNVTVETEGQLYIAAGPGDYLGQAWRFSTEVDGIIRPAGEQGWIQSQKKIAINQSPMFDMFDSNDVSFSDKSFYMNSTFKGTKLFGYTIGTGTNDSILGFATTYSSPANTGDFLFTVHMNSDQFTYTNASTGATITKMISDGYAHHRLTTTSTVKRTGWVEAVAPSVQYQVFIFDVTDLNKDGLLCDVAMSSEAQTVWSPVKIYKNGEFVDSSYYTTTVDTVAGTTLIKFKTTLTVGDNVSVQLISEQVSKTAYYQIPSNLQSNPFNTQISSIAAGDLKNYYASIFGNAPRAAGLVFGQNNLGNLGDLAKYGNTIIQNSASLLLPGVFLRKSDYDLQTALQFNADEYMDYKHTVIQLASSGDYSVYQTPASILDDIIYQISSSKSESDSFYWSDMIPSGSPFKVNTYNFGATVSFATFSTSRVYDFASANYHSLVVYQTETVDNKTITTQLVRDIDYFVSTTEPSVTIKRTLTTGSTITVKEYNQTWGSYIPNTPTKLGLFAATVPTVVLDTTYTQPTYFIVGHDGSYTRLYGTYENNQLQDFRDIVLLEFETRIYNNLKITDASPVSYTDLMPGQWRKTGYTWEDILPAYTKNFLGWVGKNKLGDYRKQVFSSNNKFTFNYNKTTNKLSSTQKNPVLLKQGNWRGIYRWFYDTCNPAAAPWEMLGITSKPQWWDSRYGAAPYTSGNALMWQDIADGRVWNNGSPYIDNARIRPELLSVLPVDINGDLVDPLERIVDNYDSLTFERGWVAGDSGPTETAYLRSSTWPFDLMKLLSAFKPASFYNLLVDRDLYKYSTELGQHLFNGRYHLDPTQLTIYGSGTAKHSYINWVVDYINQTGTDGQASVATTLKNIDVRLTYRLAGFSDKQYLRFLTENTAPSATSNSLLIPDDSYSVLLYDNVPSDQVTYSSVIIQKTERGYTVWGNSLTKPYFSTVAPKTGPYQKLTFGTTTVQLSTVYEAGSNVSIAYGTEFYTVQGTSEFLRNYGRWLTERGIMFENMIDDSQVNWDSMIGEFISWAQQSWEVGSIISLNPNAKEFKVYKAGLIVQPLTLHKENFILNQNLITLKSQNMAVLRKNEEFTVRVLSDGDTVAYTNLNLSTVEHAIVFDNKTVFGDTIYNTDSGLRQTRLIMQGKKTADWSGYVNADGFILNQADIKEWNNSTKYPKGQIVLYKNKYWFAKELIQPTDTFDYTLWTESSYDNIKQGLLPNPSTIAYESSQLYDIQQANLEQDEDLLAFGLIGFRPREYMSLAALTDVTQVNIYKNMISSKGTNKSALAFKGATPLQGDLDYDVRENWAIKNSTFGSVLNSNFVEVQLYQNLLTGNPAIIGFGDAMSSTTDFSTVAFNSGVQQKVSIGDALLKGKKKVKGDKDYIYQNDLINYGRNPANANFLPTYSLTYVEERGLPSAGYVNIDDVDYYAYNLTDLNTTATNISELYRGDVVWVANYNSKWDVFTPVSIGTTLSTVRNNLDNTVTLIFAQPHGLLEDDPFVIVDFDDRVNGYYTVKSVSNLTSLVIDLSLAKTVVKLTGTGITFKLYSVRVSQASDLSAYSEAVPFSEFSTRLSWIDEDTNGNWSVLGAAPVYEKQKGTFDVDENGTDVNPGIAGYGKSVAYTSAIGELVVANAGLYRNGALLEPISGLTAVVASGTTAICSTPSTLYVLDFSTTIHTKIPIDGINTNTGVMTLSKDTNWLYVATGTVLTTYFKVGTTYTKVASTTVDSEITSLATAKDGSKVIVGAGNQSLDVNGETYSEAGVVYVYDRASRSYLQNVTDLTKKEFPVPASRDLVKAQVYVNASLKEEGAGDTMYKIAGKKIIFNTAPPVGTTVYINYGELTLQQTITSEKKHIGANFGRSVATNRYGAEVIIGAPYELATVNEVKNVEGAVYRFTNSGQRYGTVTATVTDAAVGILYIDGFEVPYNTEDTTNDAAIVALRYTVSKRNRVAYQINLIEPTNVIATYGDTPVISLYNKTGTAAVPNDQIDIVGGDCIVGSTTQSGAKSLENIGIMPYTRTQVLNDKNLDTNSQFGWTVAVNQDDSDRDSIIVSARSVDTFSETTFDFTNDLNAMNDCIFDNGATTFIDKFPFTGGVYQYDYLPSTTESIDAPGKYTFGQYCIIPTTDAERNKQAAAPHYGAALSFTDGVITIGSPDWYKNGTGRVTTFKINSKSTKTSSWYIDKQPLTQVDVARLSTISIYDTETNKTLDRLDYIDPAQGKMLSAVETNIDVISLVDPAVYTSGQIWGANKVGTTWLDTSNIRLMNYNQPDVVYNSRYFGRAFPGSTADIYTWISSSVLPVDYSGSGYTTNFNDYTSATIIDKSSNTLATEYYFWVKGYEEVPQGKTLSPTVLSQYILNPANSGVPFLAAITTNVVALYNAQDSIQSHASALHLGYSVGNNSDRGHQDWSLIQDGNDESFLSGMPLTIDGAPSGMYLKYVTSFMGMELNGLAVPDMELPKLVRYGTSFRPRQSMFVDRELALKNYVQYANSIMSKYTITETRGLYLLNQSSYITGSVVAESSTNIYITTEAGKTVTGLYIGQPVVFKGNAYGGLEANKTYYIVSTDTDKYGQYIRVSVTLGGAVISLTEYTGSMSVKLFDTTDYWSYADWWATGYSASTKVTLEVQTYTDLLTIGQGELVAGDFGNVTLSDGLVARVVKNGQGVNEYYVYSSTTSSWTRIGLQKGTISIDTAVYTTVAPIPSMEIYYIIRWIAEQLYVNELLIENNQSLIMMFNLIQSEGQQQQNYLPWLNKTSLIDVKHTIRQLLPYKQYKRDTRELVEGYLKEVKPYHVYIKDFSFTYDGTEYYNGSFTDFDLPAQYDTTTGKFLSPQLAYTSTASADQYSPTNTIWTDAAYSSWFKNYGLTISNSQVSAILVTGLTDDLSNTGTSIVVNESSVLPVNGIIKIGNETIKYTILDRSTNTISGLTRGLNFQQPTDYAAGTSVYLLPEAVMVMDSGRGYTSLPAITAHYDTTEYPYAPREQATFVAGLTETKLSSVTLTNSGSGYPVLPEIRVASSSITGTITSSQVDIVLHQIYLAGHQFVTGDCVIVSNIEDDSKTVGLKNNRYYYVNSVDEDHIALYNSYRDALVGYTTVEKSLAYESISVTKTITISQSFEVDALPFRTGDRIKLILASAPSTPLYYYVENLGVTPASVVSGKPLIALYSTYSKAMTGLTSDRVSVSGVGSISNLPDVDADRVAFTSTDKVDGVVAVTARVKLFTDNLPTREMRIGMKFDRVSYLSYAKDWNQETSLFGDSGWDTAAWGKGIYYSKNQLAVYNGTLYRANRNLNTTALADTFNLAYWDEVDSSDLSLTAADRIAGFYKPNANMPGFTMDDMSQLMTGVTSPWPTVKDPAFADTKTYAFVSGQVDLSNHTVQLRDTKPEVVTYVELIDSTSNNIINLTALPAVTDTSNVGMTLKSVDNVRIGDRIKFDGSLIGNILNSDGTDSKATVKDKSYVIKSINAARDIISISNTMINGTIGNAVTFTDASGYMTVLPVEYSTSNLYANGNITLNTTSFVENNSTVRFSNTSVTINATRTYSSTNSATPNQILVDTTKNIATGMTITFSGTSFGNISNSTTYFVKQVIDTNHITVSETLLGEAHTLTANTGALTAKVIGTFGKYNVQVASNTYSSNNFISVGSTDGLYAGMPVSFTGTMNGGLSNISTVGNNYYSVNSVSTSTLFDIKYTSNNAVVTLANGNKKMLATFIADGIINDSDYYVTSVNANNNVTLSSTVGGGTVKLLSATGVMSADISSFYLTSITDTKELIVNSSDAVNSLAIGDSIYFTGTSVGNVAVGNSTTNLYTVKSLNPATNKITVAEIDNLSQANGGHMTMWRVATPVKTAFATSDMVKVVYTYPTNRTTDYYFVHSVANTQITLHDDATAAVDGSNPVYVPDGAIGTVIKPQTIVALTDPIGYDSELNPRGFKPGTALEMTFEQSSNPTNFGLVNYKTYWVGIIDSVHAAVYESKDDAENDTNRIPLLNQVGGQFLYGITYDSIIKSPRDNSDTQVDIVGASFTSGYSPEEMVAGIVTDGINFTVTTRPGSTWEATGAVTVVNSSNLTANKKYKIVSLGTTDWNTVTGIPGVSYKAGDEIIARTSDSGTGTVTAVEYGHTGFNMVRISAVNPKTVYYPDGTKIYTDSTKSTLVNGIQFKDTVVNPVTIIVYGNDNYGQTRLTPTTKYLTGDYTVDWINQVVTFTAAGLAKGYVSYDIVVYEFGNGSHLVRSSSKYYPLKKVQDNKDSATKTYHSEIHLDVPYSQVELPTSDNFGLSTMVFAGSTTSDTTPLTYLTDITNPEYGSTDPLNFDYEDHYTIEPQRPYDPVNDPYNPAKIVFSKLYSNETDYVSFVLTTNVIGMFVVSTTDMNSTYIIDGVECVKYVAPLNVTTFNSLKLLVSLNDSQLTPKSIEYTNNFVTIMIDASKISVNNNIKVSYDSNGAGAPMTQWINAAQATAITFIEPVNTVLKSVSVTGTGGELSFQSTTVNYGTAWDNTKEYKEGAIVRYSGARYSAVSSSIGDPNWHTTVGTWVPSEWTLADIKVVISGTLNTVASFPVWDDSSAYAIGTVVNYGGALYSANVDITAPADPLIPNTWNAADWTLVQMATITGYTGTSTTYDLTASNNSTTITLSGVTTTSGRTDGLTFTVVASTAVTRIPYTLTGFLGDDNYSSIVVNKIRADGFFEGHSTIEMKVNDVVTITGLYTPDPQNPPIAGYHSPKKYYIAETDGYSIFKLTSYFGGVPDVAVTAGPTTGLTFSLQNNLVVEIDGLRVDGPSATQTYRKIIQVGKDELKLSYPTPVYGINEFDINYFTVLVNGSTIPQVNPSNTAQVNWSLNYDFAKGQFYQFDADFINAVFNPVIPATDAQIASGAWGFFDDGTPFDNQSSFNVVFNPTYLSLKTGDIVTLSYQVPGQIPPDTFTITVNDNKLGGTINIITSAIPSVNSKVAITSFGRTTNQSLRTQRVTDATINVIPRISTLVNTTTGSPFKGLVIDGTNPPLLTLDAAHSLTTKSPLQQVIIHGTAIRSMDGRRFYTSDTNYKTGATVQDKSRQVYLYNIDNPTSSTGWDTTAIAGPFSLTGSSYLQLLNIANTAESTIAINPLVINQPAGFKMTNVDRLYVSIIYGPNSGSMIGHREYVPTSKLSYVQYEDVSTLLIRQAVAPGDEVLITSMVPTASPNEGKFRINNTWNIVSGEPNSTTLHRENQVSRTYVTNVYSDTDGTITSFRVNNPHALVKKAVFSGTDSVLGSRTLDIDSVTGLYYCTVDNVNNKQVANIVVTAPGTTTPITSEFSFVGVSNATTVKILFNTRPVDASGIYLTKVDVTISAGNTVMINGEQLRYTNINLDYSSPSYGIITGLFRGLNTTGDKEIKVYDIVQSILDENISDTGNLNKTWYSNIIETTLPSANSVAGVHTFPYVATISSDGTSTLPEIGMVKSGDTIAFKTQTVKVTTGGNITVTDYISSNVTANVIYTNASSEEYVYATYYGNYSSTYQTMELVSTAGITIGMYITGNGVAADTTVTQIFGSVITLSKPLVSGTVLSSGDIYTFYNLPTTTQFQFITTGNDNIKKVKVGSKVLFKHGTDTVTTATGSTGKYITVASSANITAGQYVSGANIDTLRVMSVNGSTIELNANSAGTISGSYSFFNAVSIVELNSNNEPQEVVEFTVTNSHKSTDATWTIEIDKEPAVRVGDVAVMKYHDFDIITSQQVGNTWVITTTENPNIATGTNALAYMTYAKTLPMQFDEDSMVATFLNKQIR